MNSFFNSAIDMGAKALKDQIASATGGDKPEEKQPESVADQMADMFTGGSKKESVADQVADMFSGGSKKESFTDKMVDVIGGGSKKDDKDQSFKGMLCDVTGKCVGLVAADKAAEETKGMGSTISNLASKAAGKAAADQASEKASDMLADLFGK